MSNPYYFDPYEDYPPRHYRGYPRKPEDNWMKLFFKCIFACFILGAGVLLWATVAHMNDQMEERRKQREERRLKIDEAKIQQEMKNLQEEIDKLEKERKR